MSDNRRREIADELIRASKVLGSAGCLPATDGNLSSRVDRNHVLLTARGLEKRDLKPSDLIEVGIHDENPPRGSSEWPMHRALYLAREEVNCILHVHSPALTAFAAAHRVPRTELLAEAWLDLGKIVLVPFCRPGTKRVGEALLETDVSAMVYILSNHGAVAVGSMVSETLHRLERAEFLAQIELNSALIGGACPLTVEQLEHLR